MLSSPRWTLLDTFAAIALVAMLARFLDTGAEAGGRPSWQASVDARVNALLPALSYPMRSAPDWIASHGPARLDGTLRCVGLAEIRAQNARRRPDSPACRTALAERRNIEQRLWPKGRPGQIAMAMYGQVGVYARAYAALSTNGTEPMRTSSQLIRDRDGAMCRRYVQLIEARLHGSEIRQSRRTVQESAG